MSTYLQTCFLFVFCQLLLHHHHHYHHHLLYQGEPQENTVKTLMTTPSINQLFNSNIHHINFILEQAL